jgi:LacI family transcriptional regulator
MLASLAHYRSALRPVAYHATLAWVTNHRTRGGWREVPIFLDYQRGAAARAAELGYRLEEFWLREPGMTPARAGQILGARNITGLILAPQPEPGMAIDLDWTGFSAVAIGYSLARPRLHLVCPAQFGAIKLAMHELLARGYRRPGLVMLRASDDRVDQHWQGGFLVAQQARPARDRVPPLFLEAWDEARFAAWFARHAPDAVITKLPEVGAALRRRRRAGPAEVGVAYLTLATPGGDLAGVHENPAEVGAAAVDYLSGMIHRNERGLPARPRRLLIEGTWVDGRTVRRAAPAAPA